MIDRLQFSILTPHAAVFEGPIEAARLSTETGLVGIRPRAEPMLLAVEPGLALLRVDGQMRFAATAGGLFEGDREHGILYTPYATVGGDADAMIEALDLALQTPDSELAARRRLGELEEKIARELRGRPTIRRTREGRV
jgi:F0F1-type ATP synthase epsilon subunit